jgi:hypothetical protein
LLERTTTTPIDRQERADDAVDRRKMWSCPSSFPSSASLPYAAAAANGMTNDAAAATRTTTPTTTPVRSEQRLPKNVDDSAAMVARPPPRFLPLYHRNVLGEPVWLKFRLEGDDCNSVAVFRGTVHKFSYSYMENNWVDPAALDKEEEHGPRKTTIIQKTLFHWYHTIHFDDGEVRLFDLDEECRIGSLWWYDPGPCFANDDEDDDNKTPASGLINSWKNKGELVGRWECFDHKGAEDDGEDRRKPSGK